MVVRSGGDSVPMWGEAGSIVGERSWRRAWRRSLRRRRRSAR